MIEVIDEYAAVYPDRLAVHENVPRPDFVSLLDSARCLVGNSSAGIVEAPSFGLPTVNVGTRQTGREKASNVIETGYDAGEIQAALERALHDVDFREVVDRRKNPYNPHGDADVSGRILDVIGDLEPTRDLLDKRITY
jgi:UDP-N-acetylglucosamine 2-epimerase (non-hydrolysing)/GDP/UDP-N,N'-diacetylbacillosamine 2-epimerase (hydrolysing)